ncbi:FKBP-type peptidyl-prolyl cis-trans isomerase [Aeromicrobium sp. NPDC092404]|uniref:FKBP-type peptidyl-prolyl cis-trans isomerase n=1 Tax=Aeromicrobium sp. NPDC092404 TaxID=3154976 RepID=UPI0034222BA9
MRRILLATVAATSLVLAGCGGSDSGGAALGDVKVSSAKSPKVTVDKGFKVSKTTTKVLKKGGGEALADGDAVKVNYVAVNGRTGKQFDSSFTTGKPLTLTLDKTAVLPGFVKGLSGKNIGSRVLVAIPPKDGFGEANAQLDLKKGDTMVFLFDVVSKAATEASGTAKKLPADVPTLKLDADKKPSTFVKTKKTPGKITKASAHVLIEGKGPEIKMDQTLNVHYLGQIYPAGKVFDSSWSRGAPTTFPLSEGQLIKCWTDLLPGQRVGSRVVLECPADVAYGDKGQGEDIKKGDTLIFAIDLLDAS